MSPRKKCPPAWEGRSSVEPASTRFARRLGCHLAQGYLLAKPAPEEQCRRYLSGVPLDLTEERDPLSEAAFEATGT